MPAARTDILLTINSNLEGIRKVQEAFLAFKRQTEEAKGSISELGKSFGSLATMGAKFGVGALAGFTSLRAAVAGFQTLMKTTIIDGVKFNATLEQAAFGIASVLKTFDPAKYKTFGAAVAESTGLIDQLRKKALETPATFEELLAGFQGAAGAMSAANIPLKKQVDLVVNMSQAMAALGVSTQELRQETTALLMGNIDRNARVAKTLGITSEDIAGAKARGELYEFLTGKLSAFAEAGRLAQNSISVLESNLKDAVTQNAAVATKDLAEAYRGLLQSMTALAQSDGFKNVVLFLSTMAETGLKTVTQVANAFGGSTSNAGTVGPVLGAQRGLLDARNMEAVNATVEKAAKRVAELQKEYAEFTKGGSDLYRSSAYFKEHTAELLSQKKAWEDLLAVAKRRGNEIVQGNAALAEQEKREAALKRIEQDKKNLVDELGSAAQKNAEAEETAREKSLSGLAKLEELKRKVFEAQMALRLSPSAQELSGADGVTPAAAAAAESARAEASARLLNSKRELAEEEAKIAREKKKSEEDEIRRAKELAAEKKKAEDIEDRHRAKALADAAEERQREQRAKIQRIESNRFLTDRMKRGLLYDVYRGEAGALPDQIAAAQAGFNTSKTDSAMQVEYKRELDRLRDRQKYGNPADLEANRPLTVLDETKQGLASLADSFATIGQTISQTIGSALNSVSENITGLIMRTQTWGDALRNIANTILTSVVGAIVQASVQWIARKLIEVTLGATLQKAALAASIPVAAGFAALWAGPAALATIASFGGAALAAPASIAGATAMTKVLALANFDVGGYTGPGGAKEVAGVVHRGEVVFSQRDVARAGGVSAVENLRVSGGMRDGGGSALGESDRSARSGGVVSSADRGEVNMAFFNTRQDAEVWLSSQRGRRVMADFLKQEQYDL